MFVAIKLDCLGFQLGETVWELEGKPCTLAAEEQDENQAMPGTDKGRKSQKQQ